MQTKPLRALGEEVPRAARIAGPQVRSVNRLINARWHDATEVYAFMTTKRCTWVSMGAHARTVPN
jgi:hypothetical protein